MLTDTLLLIEPNHFTANPDTIATNFYQEKITDNIDTQKLAKQEFDLLVKELQKNDIKTIVLPAKRKDGKEPITPDALFPNNWISFHSDTHKKAILYPMCGENRRQERRNDAIEEAQKLGFQIDEIIDLTNFENQNNFLEGTGSLVLDRKNRMVYACLSQRTDKDLIYLFCKKMDYESVFFYSEQETSEGWKLIYHTNVMMSIGENIAVVCLDSIRDKVERAYLIQKLEEAGKNILEISLEQKHHFAGNMLQVKNTKDEKFWVMSEAAHKILSQNQIDILQKESKIISSPIPTIEKYGGGSVRCMLCEVF
ncbi:arginine deiminase-related protein [Bernardetia sp. Wsw4-3y2]|uniref:citrulline utilization hydrolase CtlX n=1 Tax=Bernardetia sp. Wsw4-3y2 TaxID=3127471 RepID=UPI0030CBD023